MEVRDFCVCKTVPLTRNLHNIFFASPKIRKTPSFNQILKLQNNKPYSSEFDFGYTVFKLIGKNKNHTTSGLAIFSNIFLRIFKRFWLYCESIWVKGEKHGEDLLPLCSSSPWCWSAQSHISPVLWRLKMKCSKLLVSCCLACTLINPHFLKNIFHNMKCKSKYSMLKLI